MEYLKTYKLFETNTFEISDIKDILLELEYSRVKFDIQTTSGKFKTYIGFYLKDFNDFNGFYFNEISDCVFRLKDYLGDNMKSCSVLLVEDKEFLPHQRKIIPLHLGGLSRKDEIKHESKIINLLDGKPIENLIIQLK